MNPQPEAHVRILRGALGAMRERGPQLLTAALEFTSRWEASHDRIAGTDDLLNLLKAAGTNDPLRTAMHQALAGWDFAQEAPWCAGTRANSRNRRSLLYQLLGIGTEIAPWFDANFPWYQKPEEFYEIDRTHPHWYSPTDQSLSHYYWTAYSEYLQAVVGWRPETSISVLNERSDRIIERLACPWLADARQTRGLVVGYVQSGKTANFTAVLAKAADVGYRLFIVLGGTLDLLRSQTQRRIDKELIGKELLENEYVDDEEWDRFLSHGGARPAQRGYFDWERLTTRSNDYQPLAQGIATLEFGLTDPSRPHYDRTNLEHERARIMIVKKHQTILKRVADDLERIAARVKLDEIPTLIIDDESDQASINTRRITPQAAQREQRDRTAINRAIVRLMQLLPRAQYIGYTATPMANVFVDPRDAEDLFPRDYVIPLPRPEGYMGMTDFHDLGDDQPEGFHSNRAAFVRDVFGEDLAPANLRKALDSYLLSGAIKLWRAAHDPTLLFHHHTMLVHVASQRSPHRRMRDLLERLLLEGGYDAGPGLDRLRALFDEDYLPVMQVRATDNQMVPPTFDAVIPFVGECLRRVDEGNSRVLVVNSDANSEDPDFDRHSVWKVLVGGTKLSRGYTIEGLTVSYYRRRAGAADTLVQMGRWFGFRRGYSDLVRLFIGRAEPLGRGKGITDLYLAFEGACRDELALREEFQQYALVKDGKPGITPAQIPPLVAAHVLPPTSKNKMYNAEVQFQNQAKKYIEPTLAPSAEPRAERLRSQANAAAMAALFGRGSLVPATFEYDFRGSGYRFDARVGQAVHADVVRLLEAYQWTDGRPVLQRVLTFLHQPQNELNIHRWLILVPLTTATAETSRSPWTAGEVSFPVRLRSRVETGSRYGVFSEPVHRRVAEAWAGVNSEVSLGPTAGAYVQDGQAVLLFYAVRDKAEPDDFVTMGFGIQFPDNRIADPIRFGVRRPDVDDVVVDVPGDASI